MKYLKLTAMAMIAALTLTTGCEKDDEETPTPDPAPTAKSVNLLVRPVVGDQVLQLNTDYIINGQTVNFDFFKIYLSGISVTDDAGTVLADNDGKPVLVSTEQTVINIGTTDEDHMHMIGFDIGLDDVTNHEDPITAEGVLNDTEMHWGWNPMAGYKFVRMDYNLGADFYESHAATDALFREGVMLSIHDVDTAGETINIVVNLDLATMLESNLLPAITNHGGTPFNTAYMDALGSGLPFLVQ
jgi:hypothetical protein